MFLVYTGMVVYIGMVRRDPNGDPNGDPNEYVGDPNEYIGDTKEYVGDANEYGVIQMIML